MAKLDSPRTSCTKELWQGFPFPFCMMQHCETLKKRCYAKPKKSAKYVFFDLACDAVMENFILNFQEIGCNLPALPVLLKKGAN